MPICPYFAQKTANHLSCVLKPLIKYPITLFILLLTGYTQVFSHLYRPNFSCSPIKRMSALEHYQIPVQATEKEDIYIEEEENKRISLKEYSRDDSFKDFSYFYLPEYFQCIKNHSAFCKYFSCFSFFGPPDRIFRVLRL